MGGWAACHEGHGSIQRGGFHIVAASPTAPVAGRPRSSPAAPLWQVLLAGVLLFSVALTSRLIGLEQHLTPDDQDWIVRATRFSRAIQTGHWRNTYQSGHPAVPLLWLASLAIGQQRSSELAARAGDLSVLEKMPSYLGALFDARRALAVASAALTVLLAFLTWRLFGPGPGWLAGLLLACEPFLVAHGRLLHADLLMAQLMVASVLAALVFFSGEGGWPFLVGSGLAAGLAVLSKAPGIFLFGFVPLLALDWTVNRGWPRREDGAEEARPRRSWQLDLGTLGWLSLRLVIWGALAALVFVLLWPALWVAPGETLGRMVHDVRNVGDSPRKWGNFFFGQAVRDDVGPLFYPVVTLLRLSPITLAGFLLLAWSGRRRPRPSWWPRAASLLGYLALFTIMMTISPKKIDRYLLPVYPAVGVLAAVGLCFAPGRLLSRLALATANVSPRLSLSGARMPIGILALGLSQAALVSSVQPYPLSFYDPLLGGIGLARNLVVVGWGEGLDQVAVYLDGLPNASEIVVTSLYHDLIRPKFRGDGARLSDWQRADYLVDYVNMDQRGLVTGPLQELVRTQLPAFIARINGLEYARVYRIPPELKARKKSATRADDSQT